MKRFLMIAVFSLIIFQFSEAQRAKWDFEIYSGFIYNLPSPLKVSQEGYPDIKLWARYKSESLKLPPYYDLRITRMMGDKGWDFEFFHHKITLTNNPPEIHHFACTHGYNMFTFKRVFTRNGFIYRFGPGFVLPHVENQVRNQQLDETKGIGGTSYYIAGIAAVAAADKRFYATDWFYIALEAKVTASHTVVPVVDGKGRISLITVHGILGLGIEI